MNGHTKPGVGRACGKEISYDVTRNGKRDAARDHGVDSDHTATRVGKRSARVTWCQAHIGLHPRSRSEPVERPNRMNHTGRKSTDEAQGIADGNGKFAWPNLR